MKLLETILQDELSNAAFYLLSSSTINRFIRTAKKLASDSALSKLIKQQPALIPLIVNEVKQTWRSFILISSRNEIEIYLALSLPVLSETASPDVQELLKQIGLSTQPSASWIAALARDLREKQTVNYPLKVQPLPSHAKILVRKTDTKQLLFQSNHPSLEPYSHTPTLTKNVSHNFTSVA